MHSICYEILFVGLSIVWQIHALRRISDSLQKITSVNVRYTGWAKTANFHNIISKQPFKIKWNGFKQSDHRLYKTTDSSAVTAVLSILRQLVQSYYNINAILVDVVFRDSSVKEDGILIIHSVLWLENDLRAKLLFHQIFSVSSPYLVNLDAFEITVIE